MMPRTLNRLAVLALAAAPLALPAQQKPASSSSGSINIPFEKYTLPNGMNVIMSVDRSTPLVAVNVVYHVGSKNEEIGHTGFAHLFEHVMFTGSGHVPYGTHDRLTEGVGGMNNGQTNNDFTHYFELVPSNYLESAIWLEADRMGWLLDALDTAKYNAQREIVKNERRQSYDNQPYGRVGELLAAAVYPKNHPYSWPTIGSMTDLSAASVEDVKNFFRLYYAPNNATISIVGDFNPAEAKQFVAKYFSDVPRGRAIPRPKIAPAVITEEKRLVFEDRVQIPRLYMSWPTVGAKHDDQYALDVLGSILSGPRTARLTKALVYDAQTAASVGAGQSTSEDVGEFELSITPRPNANLTQLELAADSVIAILKRDGPTAEEVARAKAGMELQFLNGLQSNLGKTIQLNVGNIFHNDPGYFKVEYAKTQAVTAADVKRVANKYLGKGRVVLSVVPVGKKDQASKPEASKTISARSTTTTSGTEAK
jgi:zinc protease